MKTNFDEVDEENKKYAIFNWNTSIWKVGKESDDFQDAMKLFEVVSNGSQNDVEFFKILGRK